MFSQISQLILSFQFITYYLFYYFLFLIRQVKLEMDQYKEELSKMEKEIMHLKRDGENKAMHLSQLDMVLEQTKTELDKKTNAGKQQVS